ncbi:Hypothetical protein CINCED_3A011376 [Cinara cedri]|uniref:Uncharacterized protein n=1 Tax=Cinara cedri TaxID=506608 RepID=A0A5E4MT02_9HEMI|nr:Hypothetical protein CINCED_3A011376 [Cinara cedri]
MISDAWNDVFTTTIRKYFHHAGFKASLNEETEKEIVSDNNLDTECFTKEILQSFMEVDDAFLTNEEPNEKKLSILNANYDESEQADEESKEIEFKVSSISEIYFYIDQTKRTPRWCPKYSLYIAIMLSSDDEHSALSLLLSNNEIEKTKLLGATVP